MTEQKPTIVSTACVPKIVVLDDDPTGTQTVHDVAVLTEWSVPSLAAELEAPGSCFYILTNTRAFSESRARTITREIGQHLVQAAKESRRSFHVVSRSDSTLRGHYPAETDVLAEALGGNFDGTLIIPAFFDAGRVTMNDIHYVADGSQLIPVGESEFARDASFGYRSSNLRDWVEEKTRGRVRASTVVSISIDDLRGNGSATVAKLNSLSNGAVAVVNASEPADLHALAQALAVVQASGSKRFLFRTAASFVAAYAGIAPRPLLRADEIALPGVGRGLIVAGSYVGKTSVQLNSLLRNPAVVGVEISVEAILAEHSRTVEVERVRRDVEDALRMERDVALYTSRMHVTGRNASENLLIGEAVSKSLVDVVSALPKPPRWVVAKGGITSSDIATRALGVRRAIVLGQALPGVPVWQLGHETRWPGLRLIVFPGNVGDSDALQQLLTSLS